MESLSEITNNNSGGRQGGGSPGGGSPGEQGEGEGGKPENEGQAAGSIWGQAAESIWGREAGAEIKKAIVCFSLLGIIQSKTLI